MVGGPENPNLAGAIGNDPRGVGNEPVGCFLGGIFQLYFPSLAPAGAESKV